jgi:hypothetical protein
VRIRLRWVLAVYALAYASVVVAFAAADLSALPILRLLLWPALLSIFWVIARSASFSVSGSAAVAASATVGAWLFSLAEPFLEPASQEASLYQHPLLLVVFGLGTLLVLLVLWARRDGAWKGLLWLALAETGVTLLAFYVVAARGADTGMWAQLRPLALIATGNWETAVRVTLAWLIAMLVALRVRGGSRSPGGGAREA